MKNTKIFEIIFPMFLFMATTGIIGATIWTIIEKKKILKKTKLCTYCKSRIHKEATVCKFCQREQ